VGSTRMEAPWGHWGGGAEGWLQPGMGSWVVGGAVGWRSRAVGRVRDWWGRWRRHGVEAPWGGTRWVEQGMGGVELSGRARARTAARGRPPALPAAGAAQGVRDASAAPTRAESAASRACRSAVHPRACWARAPALGPGPLGASTCWHQHSGFNRRRGSTSSFTLLLFQANY
jgi:hypothetical protein